MNIRVIALKEDSAWMPPRARLSTRVGLVTGLLTLCFLRLRNLAQVPIALPFQLALSLQPLTQVSHPLDILCK